MAKKARKKAAPARGSEVLRLDSRTVRAKHTGDRARTHVDYEVAVFPAGVPIAQVGVEVNRSMEITHNHWFSCKVIETRNVVDSDAAVLDQRKQSYESALEFVDEKCREALEEVSS